MDLRKLFMIAVTIVLIVSVFAGSANALTQASAVANKAALENVRDYAIATDGLDYAVDGDHLFVGNTQGWALVETPNNVMVSAVAVDTQTSMQTDGADTIYIGAANEMAIYRSQDGGQSWTQFELSSDTLGMITEITVDSVQNLVYVGTDTAGIFRLRDVGSSLTLSNQLLLPERVQEIIVDSTGAGMAFARTDNNLYRAENFGLQWVTVNNLKSIPTAMAIAGDDPVVYVGTVDRGLLKSMDDGFTWTLANEGLNVAPGSRLQISALTVDPAQPNVLYVASNYLYGSTTVYNTPSVVALSMNEARTWTALDEATVLDGTIARLLPVAGETGAVYALTTASRAPQALGDAPAMVAATVDVTDAVGTGFTFSLDTVILAWAVAAIAALALLYAVAADLRGTKEETATVHI